LALLTFLRAFHPAALPTQTRRRAIRVGPVFAGAGDRECCMPTVKARASTILTAFEDAQSELVGKAVVLTDGKAGTVENIWLDEFHGLRISVRGHDGKWPISTIKFAQN
jgi:hypothetical protein